MLIRPTRAKNSLSGSNTTFQPCLPSKPASCSPCISPMQTVDLWVRVAPSGETRVTIATTTRAIQCPWELRISLVGHLPLSRLTRFLVVVALWPHYGLVHSWIPRAVCQSLQFRTTRRVIGFATSRQSVLKVFVKLKPRLDWQHWLGGSLLHACVTPARPTLLHPFILRARF